MTKNTVVAYYLTLTALLGASFFPETRSWGINQWAYFPLNVPIALFLIGGFVPLLLHYLKPFWNLESETSILDWVLLILLALIFGVSFYVFRTETHFLGDGYQLLSLLADENPLIRKRGVGEGLVHLWVWKIVGNTGQDAALMSYRIISISSGIAFIVAVGLLSRSLLARTWQRLCFLIGLLSGGYVLLFFGYVENYSPFVLAVATFSLTGLLAALGRMSVMWPLICLAFALFFHVFGVVLIPPAVYLILRNSTLWSRLRPLGKGIKIVIAIVGFIVAISVFYYYYSTNLFFRLAVLPMIPHELTIDGYSLFSVEHIIDYVNLLFILFPGICVAAIIISNRHNKDIRHQAEYVFLMILCSCVLGAVFLFDPKLGMPRDWDLFAFAGIPLSITFYYYILCRDRPAYKLSILVSVLGFLILGPRVAGQANPEISLLRAHSYTDIDIVKNKNLWHILIKYYEQNGNTLKADSLRTEWNSKFPERLLVRQASRILKSGQAGNAAGLCQRVLKVNPHYSDAWSNLGLAYKYMGKIDSAIICYRIADALNPYNARMLGNIASAYIYKGNILEAGRVLDDAMKIDTTIGELYYYRATIGRMRGDRREYLRNLVRAASDERAPLKFLLELAEIYLQSKDYERAGRLYKVGLDRGLEPTYVDSLRVLYPKLGI